MTSDWKKYQSGERETRHKQKDCGNSKPHRPHNLIFRKKWRSCIGVEE
jgi:hypothetical protein